MTTYTHSNVEALKRLPFVPTHVLDIGAHIGESIELFRSLWPRSEILSFEPRAARLEQLTAAERTAGNCYVFEVALSDEEGLVTIHAFQNADASSSLLPPTAYLAKTRAWADNHREESAYAVRLDTIGAVILIPKTARLFAKIDVQGAEAKVIRGGMQTFARVDAALIEIGRQPLYEGQSTFDEVNALLEQAGLKYHMAAREVVPRPGSPVEWGDYLWLR